MSSWRRAARAWRGLSRRGQVGAAIAIVVVAGLLASLDGTDAPTDVDAPATAGVADTPGEDAAPSPASTPSPSPTPTPTQAPTASPGPTATATADDPRGDGALVLRTAAVVGVVDGDTIDLDDGTRVRLAIVDTPEVHGGAEPCGREASAFTRELVLGRDVEVLRPSTAPVTDTFGRLVGEVVRVEDGTSLNVALVAAGLGDVDERFTSEDRDLAERVRAAAEAAATPGCAGAAAPSTAPTEGGPGPGGGHTGRTDGGWSCHDAYRECLPAQVADLDCADVGHQVALLGDADPWRLDGNSTTRTDGLGCGSYPAWSAAASYPYE